MAKFSFRDYDEEMESIFISFLTGLASVYRDTFFVHAVFSVICLG